MEAIPMPTGAELVRVRAELVELVRVYCPDHVAEAEALLEAARNPPRKVMRQMEMFDEYFP